MSDNYKVLRIGMSYPRETAPGMGLHPFYHSRYASNSKNELILTAKYEGRIIDNGSGVRIEEIGVGNPRLAKYDESRIKKLVAFGRKLKSQNDFKNRSKRFIDEFKPDIVHLYSPIPIITALYAKRKYKAKIVVSLHGSDALRLGKNKWLGKVLAIPDAVVTVGENIEGMLQGAKTKRPIICIGNGVDLETFKNENIPRKKQFIHVANLRWQKGQQYLIEGFAKFYAQNPDYCLIVIGDGEERENLVELSKKLGVADSVKFLGTKGREYIAHELNQSTAFVLTSVSEGFPKVIIEAMATGTPVISSDVGNVKNVVGDSGIIFPVEDSDAVSQAMLEVVSSQVQWQIYSKKAEKIAQQYSWEKHVEKLNMVYRGVL